MNVFNDSQLNTHTFLNGMQFQRSIFGHPVLEYFWLESFYPFFDFRWIALVDCHLFWLTYIFRKNGAALGISRKMIITTGDISDRPFIFTQKKKIHCSNQAIEKIENKFKSLSKFWTNHHPGGLFLNHIVNEFVNLFILIQLVPVCEPVGFFTSPTSFICYANFWAFIRARVSK